MTCPKSHSLVSGRIRVKLWDAGRLLFSLFWGGCSSLVLRLTWSLQMCGQRQFRREREMKSPLCRSTTPILMLLLTPHRALSAWRSRRHLQADMKSDEPFRLLWGRFTHHRLWVKCLFSKHPSSRIPHSDQPKKQAPFQALGVTSPRMTLKPKSVGFNAVVALAVCFCTTVNYLNHMRWQSTFQILVPIICIILYMLWYTTLVLTKGRTSFVCWCSRL